MSTSTTTVKPGDRVRYIDGQNGYAHKQSIGKVGTVIDVYPGNSADVKFDVGGTRGVFLHNLEPFRFVVGDRVLYIGGSKSYTASERVGRTGTVVGTPATGDVTISVRLDGENAPVSVYADNLTIVHVAPPAKGSQHQTVIDGHKVLVEVVAHPDDPKNGDVAVIGDTVATFLNGRWYSATESIFGEMWIAPHDKPRFIKRDGKILV